MANSFSDWHSVPAAKTRILPLKWAKCLGSHSGGGVLSAPTPSYSLGAARTQGSPHGIPPDLEGATWREPRAAFTQ